jgi:HAMP domain-containing protein
MKLQTKIISVLVPLMVVPLLVTGLLSYQQLAKTSEHRTVAEMQAKLAKAAVEVDTTLASARANLQLFANASLLSQYLLTADIDKRYMVLQKPLLRLFASYQEAFPAYSEIRVLLPDGTEDVRRSNQRDEPRLTKAVDKAFFAALSASQGDHAAFVHDEATGRVAFLLGAPIRLRGAEQDPIASAASLRGYLVISVRPDFMTARVHEEGIGQSGSLFVTDDHGHVLYHRIDKLGAALPATMLHDGMEDAGPVVASIGGTEVILLSTSVFENVRLFAALPLNEVLADSKALGLWAALVTLVAIATAASLVFLFVRHVLVRPIQDLGRAAQEIGRGDLETPIAIGRGDEVGELAAAFDDMRSNLAASNKRVRQMAYFDQLTGVPNRTLFHEYLPEAIAQTRLRNDKLAVLLLDTDNFKRINDTL